MPPRGGDATQGGPLASSWTPLDLGPVLDGDYIEDAPSVLQLTDGRSVFYSSKTNALYGESESRQELARPTRMRARNHGGNHVLFIDFEDNPGPVGFARLLELGASPVHIQARFPTTSAPTASSTTRASKRSV